LRPHPAADHRSGTARLPAIAHLLGGLALSLLGITQLQCASLPPPALPVEADGSLESRVRREVNLARSRPDVYAAYLEDWLSRFDGTDLRRPGGRLYVLHEGRPAAEEAIRFLRRARSLPPLALSDGMSRGAEDLVESLGPSGGLSHLGLDGSEVGDRLSRYGTWQRKAAEVIQCGTTDPREIVALLIVDDAVAGRAHRKVLFDADYRVMGVAVGLNRRYQHMCVITLAERYSESLAGNVTEDP
jgi:hypothetical protein